MWHRMGFGVLIYADDDKYWSVIGTQHRMDCFLEFFLKNFHHKLKSKVARITPGIVALNA